MAPIRPPKKRSGRAFPAPDSLFSATKKDRRMIKHSLILSKIKKSSDKSSGKKRRRPSKKLATTLESLVDALPNVSAPSDAQRRSERLAPSVKSLKSKPGASKKKAKIIKEERERFGKNLAVLSQTSSAPSDPNVDSVKGSIATPSTNGAWAVLRRHLENTVGNTG